MTPPNPLLDFSDLPHFQAIEARHVEPAVDTLLAAARATIERAAADTAAPTWRTLVEPIADVLDPLDRAWAVVGHLHAVTDTPELRAAYRASQPKVVAFHAELAQDPRLFARYRALRDGPAYPMLDAAQRKLVDNELRDFRLGGAELGADEQARFKAVQEELAALATRFQENLLDATNAWAYRVTDANELAGIPTDIVAAAREAAQRDGDDGWKLTLHMPCYRPVMQYADNRALRRRLHEAYATRASDLGAKPEWDNTALIRRILALRHEAALLLGYANYAEVSLVPKMANDPAEVEAFLRDLARRAQPFARRDFAELTTFAHDRLGLSVLEPWDVAYAAEKLKLDRYAYSEQEVRQYFPEERVLAGLFAVVETIYGLAIAESKAETWHPTVRVFTIRDRSGARVGEFYLDLYARPGKRGGAWMHDAITRRRSDRGLQDPVAYLVCNLSAPVGDKPATFTHDEITTIFHEFGHGLHHLLTRVDVAGVSGIRGVEWDAVELPSQFMENFCWEWSVVESMSRHVGTGALLPRALFDRMLAAKNYHSGLATVRQLEMALFDMLLHAQAAPPDTPQWRSPQTILAAVRSEVAVVPFAAYDRLAQSFAHVFAGGYAAGYYSYKWAEVLAADAFSLFEEEGLVSPTIGARFLDELLSRGGSRPALESFVAFRGRPPQLDALLRHNGMVTPA
ncbi:MAG: M3 family metallopeptidase [Burkholderiales bacterium]|nr:M3 family metallopeptidase [Burkholderiales bacterium]